MDATVQLSYALDTFHLLISGVLVMWMVAGSSMLEFGLLRTPATAETLAKGVLLYGVACIPFLVPGYGIMFPAGGNGLIPQVDWGLALGVTHGAKALGVAGTEAPTAAPMAFFFFQVMLVAMALSVVSRAMAGRVRLRSFLLFAVIMTGLIYPIQGYWARGGGWLEALGFDDFAGAGVVHLCGAAAALAGVLLLGGRRGVDDSYDPGPRVNSPLATLGTLILWLGWFGLVGGSRLEVSTPGGAAALSVVLVNTNMAAAGGVLLGLVTTRLLFGRTELTLVLSGALGGLVAITAEPLTPSPLEATLVGACGGILAVLGIRLLAKLRIYDPAGAISVHGIVGIWGLLAVPLTNPEARVAVQSIGLGAILGWSFVTAFFTWLVVRLVFGIRVREEWAGGDEGG